MNDSDAFAMTVKIAVGSDPCPGGCNSNTEPTSAVDKRLISTRAATREEDTCETTTRGRDVVVGTPCSAAACVQVADKLPQLRSATIAAIGKKRKPSARQTVSRLRTSQSSHGGMEAEVCTIPSAASEGGSANSARQPPRTT